MTSQRVQPTPVNLKERIAALQQRNDSSRRQSISPASVSPTTQSSGLRDKIAQFEQKGGVPVPRGSFGLGAPPVPASGPSRRTGELYGNRIPSVSRSTSGGISLSRSTSPLLSGTFTPTGRSRSPSVDVDDYAFNADHSPVLSGLPSSPSSSGPNSLPNSPSSSKQSSSLPLQSSPNTSPRKDYFTHALRAARRNSSAIEAPKSFGRFPETSSLEPLTAKSVSQPVFVHEDVISCTPAIPEDSTEPFYVPSAEDSSGAPLPEPEYAVGLENDLLSERHSTEEPTSLHSHDESEKDASVPEIGNSDAPNTSVTPEDVSIQSPIQDSSSSDEGEDSLPVPSENPPIHAPAIRVFLSDEDETIPMCTIPIPRITVFLDEKNSTSSNDPEDFNSQMAQMEVVDQDEVTARLSMPGESSRSVFSPDSPSVEAIVPTKTTSFESSFAERLMTVIPSSEITSTDTRSPEEYQGVHISQIDDTAPVDNGLSSEEVVDDVRYVADNGTTGNVIRIESPTPPSQDTTIVASPAAVHIDPTDEDCHIRQNPLNSHTSSLRTLSRKTSTPDLLGSAPSHERHNIAPIINIITPTDSEMVITPIAGRLSGPSSPHKSESIESETLDLIQDYGRLSLALDLDPINESHTNQQSPSTPPSQSSSGLGNTLILDLPDSPRSHDRPKSAPIISVISPIDAGTVTPLAASPRLATSPPSTFNSQEPASPKDDNSESLHEFGSVSLHMHSHSYSHPHRSLYPEPEFASSLPKFDTPIANPVAFSAVVHQKVTELPASTLSPLRERKVRMSHIRGGPSKDLPPVDPAELQLLVQDTVLLEKLLEEGDHPREYQPAAAPPFLEPTPKNAYHPDRNGLEKKNKSSSKKGESRYKPIFHRALSSPSVAKAMRTRSIDAIRELQASSPARPLIVEPFGSDTTTLTDQQREERPTKSPHRRYFSTIRKLAGTAGVMPAIFPRKSQSTSSDFSSEESTIVDTQPDHVGPYTGRRNRLISSNTIGGSSLSVDLAHKKNAALARASSFAERLLKRTRTKSSSTVSEEHDPPTQPPLLTLPLVLSVPDPNSSLAPPVPRPKDAEDRRRSWVSKGSSASSSPLDRELFDSFPSVPEATPSLSSYRLPVGRPPIPFFRDEKNTLPTQYDPQQASLEV